MGVALVVVCLILFGGGAVGLLAGGFLANLGLIFGSGGLMIVGMLGFTTGWFVRGATSSW